MSKSRNSDPFPSGYVSPPIPPRRRKGERKIGSPETSPASSDGYVPIPGTPRGRKRKRGRFVFYIFISFVFLVAIGGGGAISEVLFNLPFKLGRSPVSNLHLVSPLLLLARQREQVPAYVPIPVIRLRQFNRITTRCCLSRGRLMGNVSSRLAAMAQRKCGILRTVSGLLPSASLVVAVGT